MKKVFLLAAAFGLMAGGAAYAQAAGTSLPMGLHIQLDNAGTPQETAKSIQILLLLRELQKEMNMSVIRCNSSRRFSLELSLAKFMSIENFGIGAVICSSQAGHFMIN